MNNNNQKTTKQLYSSTKVKGGDRKKKFEMNQPVNMCFADAQKIYSKLIQRQVRFHGFLLAHEFFLYSRIFLWNNFQGFFF